MSASLDVDPLIEALVATAFAEPRPGLALFAFFTREEHRSLEADEVKLRFQKKQGALVVELVYDDDLELLERGQGTVVRTNDDLVALAQRRARAVLPKDVLPAASSSSHARDPSLAATAPKDDGTGRAKPKTSIPWHPGAMDIPIKKR